MDLFPTLWRRGPSLEEEEQEAPLQALLDAWVWAPEEAEPGTAPSSSYVCPTCRTDAHVEVVDGRVLCGGCASLLEFTLDAGPEYRYFGAEDRGGDPARVGGPTNPLLPESSLGTTILLRRGHGAAMRRVKKYHCWNLMPYRERTLWGAFDTLQVRCSNAGISHGVVEEAKELYAHLSTLCVCRGAQKGALMAACVYEALKRSGSPRRPREVALAFDVDAQAFTRGLKQCAQLLQLHGLAQRAGTVGVGSAAKRRAAAAAAAAEAEKVASLAAIAEPPPTVDTAAAPKAALFVLAEARRAVWQPRSHKTTRFEDFVPPFVARLGAPRALTAALQELALRVGTAAEALGVVAETTPPSLAAAALAVAVSHLGVEKTLAEVAAACGISAATIHKCTKRLEAWKAHLLPFPQGRSLGPDTRPPMYG